MRLLFSANQEDYQANLLFCCDHYRSVSEMCRRLRINRQQFNRYLTGNTVPSRHNHRRLSDFFGLEEYELFMPHEEFVASFRRRIDLPTIETDRARAAAFLGRISGNLSSLRQYEGYYFKYFYALQRNGLIRRELVHWRIEGDTMISTTKQRYVDEQDPDLTYNQYITYRGIVSSTGDRIFSLISDRSTGRDVSMAIWYPRGRNFRKL